MSDARRIVRRSTVTAALENLQAQIQELREVMDTHDIVEDDDPILEDRNIIGVEVHCGRGSAD